MKKIIISGASRGIGRAIADDLPYYIEGEYLLLSTVDVDFTDYHAVYEYVKDDLCKKQYEEIYVALCASQVGTAHSLSLTEIDSLYKINVLGNMAVIKAVMESGAKLRMIWFAGGGAAKAFPEFIGYSLTKTATVRAVENISCLLNDGDFIIALSPGAVATDMLAIVEAAGCKINSRSDISEPVSFVRDILTSNDDAFLSVINGRYFHVKDKINIDREDKYLLRRIE